MKQTFKTIIAAASVAAIVMGAGIASADITKEQAKCHGAIAKNIAKYQSTLVKNMAACHKARNANKTDLSKNCNNAVDADLKLKRTAAIQKIKDTIIKSCPMQESVIAANYPRCPSPFASLDDAGATSGIDDFNELTDCLVAVSEHYVGKVGEEVIGGPLTASIGVAGIAKGQQTCANALAKGISGVLKGATSALKCQAAQEKILTNSLDYQLSCVNDAAVGAAITKELDKFTAAIDKSCDTAKYMLAGASDFRNLRVCGESIAQLKTCARDRAALSTAKGLVALALEIPNDGGGQAGNLVCKAGGADVIINAGYGQKRTNTRLDAGYTGFSHNVDVIDQYKGRVLLTGCDQDCENCSVTMDTSAGNCRCEGVNSNVQCTTIEGPDPACGGGTCHCMFGPPLALSASGTPTCVVNRFASDFTGSTGAIGTYDVTTETRALVHTGLGVARPCPICGPVGTPLGATSTCQGGDRDTLACTVNAVHPRFGPSSFDCPPAIATNISGDGLRLALQFKSGTATITAGQPVSKTTCSKGTSSGIACTLDAECSGGACAGGPNIREVCTTDVDCPGSTCTPATCDPVCASGTCHCSVCSGDDLVGCSTDQECADLGVGTCGMPITTGGGNPSQNECTGGPSECVADSENPGMGNCDNGPYGSFCDGFEHGSGGGIIPCASDGDCTLYNLFCPGNSCGTCSLNNYDRSCFLPTVTATGVPGIFNSEGVSTFCSAPTGNSGVDSAGGLPGPGRVRLDFDFNVWCDGSTTNRFNLPMGSNCP
jgi:hypothetical protein